MKKYLFLLLFFAPASVLLAQSQYEKEPYLVKSLSKEMIKNIEARTSGGSISVAGTNGSDARIEVFVSPNNNDGRTTVSKEELKQRLEELYDLNISVENNLKMCPRTWLPAAEVFIWIIYRAASLLLPAVAACTFPNFPERSTEEHQVAVFTWRIPKTK
jgi:hypothetical protein